MSSEGGETTSLSSLQSSSTNTTPSQMYGFLKDMDLSDLDRFKDDPLIKQAITKGIELKAYGTQIESDLRNLELASVQEYVDQSENVLKLHQNIEECDSILAKMQSKLEGFQTDLSGISKEIKHLQEESNTMSIKLNNRRETEGLLSNFLDTDVITQMDVCRDEKKE